MHDYFYNEFQIQILITFINTSTIYKLFFNLEIHKGFFLIKMKTLDNMGHRVYKWFNYIKVFLFIAY